MSDLLEKRTIQERLIIAKTLLETVLDDLPSELSNNSSKLDNENGELISREEVLKLPQRKGYAVNGWETYIRVSDIKDMPSVQPDKDLIHLQKEQSYMQGYEDGRKPRKGKWAGVDGLYGCGIYICDQCGKFAMMKTDYCPNCGARMDMREGDAE